MANEYISPTGFINPTGSWRDEAKAYDGDIQTPAVAMASPYSWTNFLELTIKAIYCSKVKFFAGYGGTGGINKIDLDVYYADAWHNVYEGSYLDRVYVEKSLDATYYVTKMRFRFYNSGSDYKPAPLGEAMFYETVGIPIVTTNAATSVGDGKATLNGNITSIGGAVPTIRGFKYKEGIAGSEQDTSDSGYFAVGAYSKNLTGLDPTKKYYFKAYATNSAGTGYGAWKSFGEDVDIPTVTTSAATLVTHEQATLNGNITETGGQDPTERGFQWKIGATGYVETLPETGVFGVGAYSLLLDELNANITYYFRAYAKNAGGTAYGSWLNFTTDYTTPTVITHNATDELETQVTGNGEIVSTGGKDCDERGFEYGLSKVATWEKKESASGYGVGFFNLTIDGLTANTEYWYRAWAKYIKPKLIFMAWQDDIAVTYHINVYDNDGVFIETWDIEATENIGNALAVDINSNVYTITGDQHYIKKRNSSGTLTLTKTETHFVYGIATGSDGYIYTFELKSDSSTYQISKRNASDLEIVSSKSMGSTDNYYGFAIDSDGDFYFVNGTSNEYERWDFTTGLVSSVAAGHATFNSIGVSNSLLADVHWLNHALTRAKDLSGGETDVELEDMGSPGACGSMYGEYFLFSGYDASSMLVLGKYDTSLAKVWTVVVPDSANYGYSSIGSYPFAELSRIGYGEWVKFITAAPGEPGDRPAGYKNDICSDYSGGTFILNRSLTDDGVTYESYFVLSTDLSGKQTLHTNKRLLDIFSYFANKGTGTAKVYVKRDTEPAWQYAGEISLTGEEEIIIKHLPSENEDSEGDVDFLAKTFLIKFVFQNDFEFIGMITEAVPMGDR